ncbi:MAG TPA: nucleotidyl transferase AbiEii/AbiGii toxin family protein, partial [Bacteroidia bacterium]|nr:nucleotidyl transferase AbiEii/AbiGii toxin family protein [Bacteroidia bacterium]
MMEWCKLASNRKRTILDEIASRAGLPGQAIEKDWWVTQCLRAVFQTSVSEHIVFKGGTSLSKGWGLIERFSEDIDLSVSRDYLGYGGELSSNQL